MAYGVKETKNQNEPNFKLRAFGTDDKPDLAEVYITTELIGDWFGEHKIIWGKPVVRVHSTAELTHAEAKVVNEALNKAICQSLVFKENFCGVEVSLPEDK